MCKLNEIEGLKCKRRNESPNCDKPNMALSPKIGIRPNMVLEMRELSHLVRVFTIWERSKKFGVELSISWFPIVQAKRRKRRREEIQVWNSHIC